MNNKTKIITGILILLIATRISSAQLEEYFTNEQSKASASGLTLDITMAGKDAYVMKAFTIFTRINNTSKETYAVPVKLKNIIGMNVRLVADSDSRAHSSIVGNVLLIAPNDSVYMAMTAVSSAAGSKSISIELHNDQNGTKIDLPNVVVWQGRVKSNKLDIKVNTNPKQQSSANKKAKIKEAEAHIEALGSNNISARYEAHNRLLELSPYSIPCLLETLSDPNKLARRQAVLCLNDLTDEELCHRKGVHHDITFVQPFIAGFLIETDIWIRWQYLFGMAHFQGLESQEHNTLVETIRHTINKSESKRLRVAAAISLLRLSPLGIYEVIGRLEDNSYYGDTGYTMVRMELAKIAEEKYPTLNQLHGTDLYKTSILKNWWKENKADLLK